jgi:single-stranded DNA-binding protein
MPEVWSGFREPVESYLNKGSQGLVVAFLRLLKGLLKTCLAL